jgi:radical SAM superfamily enzyme YgiQ (UPF0313 family)
MAAGGQPLVVAGGVATFMNPEPLAPFVDLFIIGEAEPILDSAMALLLPGIGRKHKVKLLEEIGTNLPGCYAPVLYEVSYSPDGALLSNNPRKEFAALPQRIKRVFMDSPGNIAAHSHILTPLAEFSDLYMTELGRGFPTSHVPCLFPLCGQISLVPLSWNCWAAVN